MKDGDMSLFGAGVIVGMMVIVAIWLSYEIGKTDGVKCIRKSEKDFAWVTKGGSYEKVVFED